MSKNRIACTFVYCKKDRNVTSTVIIDTDVETETKRNYCCSYEVVSHKASHDMRPFMICFASPSEF
jgi:hypothetical protein